MTPPIQQTPSGAPRAARRRAGAAGTARRSLERDLARREASLRISRRVSGPAGGVARPAATAAPAPTQRPAQPPISRAPQGRSAAAQVSAPIDVPEFLATGRGAAQPRPAVQPRLAAQPRPAARSSVAPAAMRPVLSPRGARLTPASPAGATAHAHAPAPAHAHAPALAHAPAPRPVLQALRGGLSDEDRATGRLSTVPRMIVTSVVLLVVTVGVVLATQIAMTQINEQIGANLGTISRLEQANTGLAEGISGRVAAAPVLGEARSRGLEEPEPGDVRAVRAGDRELTAERAAKALSRAAVVTPGATASTATSAPTGTSAAAAAAAATATGAASPTAGSSAGATAASSPTSTVSSAAPAAAAATGIAPTP